MGETKGGKDGKVSKTRSVKETGVEVGGVRKKKSKE